MAKKIALYFIMTSYLVSCGDNSSLPAGSSVQVASSAIVGFWQSSCLKLGEKQSQVKYYAISRSRLLLTHIIFNSVDNCQGEPDARDRFYADYSVALQASNTEAPLVYPFDLTFKDVRRTYLQSVSDLSAAFGYSTWQVGEEKSIAGRSVDNGNGATVVSIGEKSYQIISFLQNDRFVIGKIDEQQRPNTEAKRATELDLSIEFNRDGSEGAGAQLPEFLPSEEPGNTE